MWQLAREDPLFVVFVNAEASLIRIDLQLPAGTLSTDLAEAIIDKMKQTREFEGFPSIKKNRNYIICSKETDLSPP